MAHRHCHYRHSRGHIAARPECCQTEGIPNLLHEQLRQLELGHKMYGDDNQQRFPPNPDYPDDYSHHPFSWVSGEMSGSPAGTHPGYSVPDPVNAELLVDATWSAVAPYSKNPKIYRCPADQSTWSAVNTAGNKEESRVRSSFMSQAVGCAANGTQQDPGHEPIGHWLKSNGGSDAGTPGPWRVFAKETDIQGMSPSDLWVSRNIRTK